MKSLTKRELVIIVSSIIVIVLMAVNMARLGRSQTERNRTNSTSLSTKQQELNTKENYTDTICAEYRKLYAAYTQAITHTTDPASTQYAIPGSAKGDIDPCYQP